jgi:2-keto-4-pentenoate hydratase/2-oxohepta-3-ene-1,7-dioic acid hydratase in catechol pathway
VKLASYLLEGEARVGIVTDRGLVDVTDFAADAPTSMRPFLAWIPGNVERFSAGAPAATAVPLDEVTFLPVVPDPHAIWCAALTYLSHVREGGDRPVPDYPLFFLRVANSQVGHDQPMLLPRVSDQLDYEGELAVVIGKRGRHITEEDALSYIAGYSCYNDASVRDWQRHTPQITPGKNFEATGGFGPWLVTQDEFGDPDGHGMVTRLNGEVMQSARFAELLFSIAYQIHYLSTICTLEIGDVIVTGTSGGVGLRRNPPLFMKEGDVIEVEIDGIGTLRNTVAPEQTLIPLDATESLEVSR